MKYNMEWLLLQNSRSPVLMKLKKKILRFYIYTEKWFHDHIYKHLQACDDGIVLI
jgi:hypothetical protein